MASPYPTLEAKWAAHVRETDGGHMEWLGERGTSSGTPLLRWRDRQHPAARVAFRIRTGRDPQGRCMAECGRHHCVAPDHVEDAPGRAALREQLRYLSGLPARAAACRRGHDQQQHGRYDTNGRAYCNACINDRNSTCPNGHRWTRKNTRIHHKGDGRRQRECRECHREKLRRRRADAWAARHAGHDYTHDALGRRRCLTCRHPSNSRDVDPAAVERAIAGDPPPVLSIGDLTAAVQKLSAWGLSNTAMADRVGCSDRTVQRIRTRARQETAA